MFSGEFSGEKLGLVKEHKGLTLNQALARIDKPRLDDFPYSVHAFRGVMQPMEMPGLNEITRPLQEFAFVQTMASVSERKIYKKTMTSVDLAAARSQSIVTPEFDCNRALDVSNPHAVASYVEDYFLRMTGSGRSALYFYNCDRTPPGFQSCLDGISSHLHASRHPGIAIMPGINEPMFYAGGADSITEMHVEDGIADSVNIIHAGKEKLWFVVDKRDYVRLNASVAGELKKRRVPTKCDFPLHHKNMVLTPHFLDYHEIRYEFVTQRAGDFLFVKYGVPHQVINVGPNIAEAVNVGSAEWNISNPLHTFCQCSRASIKPLQENVNVNHSVNTGRLRPTHVCDNDACQKEFATKALLQSHHQQVHSFRHRCTVCDKTYAQDTGLARHMAHDHRERRNCSYCGKSFADIRRHERNVHEKRVNCPTCKAAFSMDDMRQHARVCSIEYSCIACKRNFASKQSLGNHRARCKARE